LLIISGGSIMICVGSGPWRGRGSR